jgi:UDP-N-acetylmuramoylalanine--D-glutamate ligase
VTALTGELLKAGGCKVLVGGNIGVPALDLLNEPVPDFYVLELSSFQLETTTNLDARAAVILNISPDHLDRYAGLREYAAAKARIWRGRGTVIVNRDDAGVQALAQPLKAAQRKLITFGLDAPASVDDFGIVLRDGAVILSQGPHDIMPASEVPLPGRHNLANVLAAAALADQARVAPVAIRAGVREFRGLPHRSELIGEHRGVRYINDSKGTNVGATVAALAGMDAPVVLIAGGQGKGQSFDDMREACRKRARAVVLIGQDAGTIEAALAGVVPVQRADSMESAVHAARDMAQPGDIVLLSPACASFDMFRDYRDRGEIFARIVRGLPS